MFRIQIRTMRDLLDADPEPGGKKAPQKLVPEMKAELEEQKTGLQKYICIVL